MTPKIKILFISLDLLPSFMPLAFMYLKAIIFHDALLRKKTEICIKQYKCKEDLGEAFEFIKTYHPDIVGFSCYLWNFKQTMALAELIKGFRRNIRIVIGGPEIAGRGKDVLKKYKDIDIAITGEGEGAFRELVKVYELKEKGFRGLEHIQGVVWRKNKNVVENAERFPIDQLDKIPSPFDKRLFDFKNREVCIETKRGCEFNCAFCFYNKKFKRVRFFSLRRIKKDLKALLEQKAKIIYLMDPIFNLPLKRAKEILRFIAKNNKNNTLLHTEIHADFIDEKFAKLLKQANCLFIEIGLQSSSQEVLKRCNRPTNIGNLIQGMKYLKKYGISTELHLILGLPGDTAETFMNSLKLAVTLEPSRIAIIDLQILPGTAFYQDAKRMGITYSKESPRYFKYTKELSLKQSNRFKRIAAKLNILGGMPTVKFLCKETHIDILEFIDLWIKRERQKKISVGCTENNPWISSLGDFLADYCRKHRIDPLFYRTLLEKDIPSLEKAATAMKKASSGTNE